MAVTYGGVELCFPTAAAQAWIDANLTLRDVLEFSNVTFPQSWLSQPPRLGRLHWPVGASCWATGHYLATDLQLNRIRQQAYDPAVAGKYKSLPLVLDDENGHVVTTSLFMLPPRPLAQVEASHELYLLTLVDARYYWRGAAVNIGVTGGTTTWANIFSAIATALGTPITTDAINSAYLKPAEALTSRYGSVPELLDRVCDSVGHRLVRNLDGTIATQAPRTAIARYTAQYPKYDRQAGGKFRLFATDTPNDLATVPGTVLVVFPRSDSGVPSTSLYTLAVTLTSLALPEYPKTITGSGAVKVVYTTADADFAGGGTPTNQTELQTLANQLATDYYLWLLARLDVAYAGAVPWHPEGYHDVFWDWTAGKVQTRVLPTTRRDADANPFGAPSNVANYYSTYGTGPLTINTAFIFNQPITVNNTLFFPTVNNQATTPGPQLSYPTCTAPGPPTWIPKPGYYPTVWVSSTNTLYFWNGTAWVAIPSSGGGATATRAWEYYRQQAVAPFAAYSTKLYHIVGTHGVNTDTPNTTDTLANGRLYLGMMIFPGGGTIDRIAMGLGGATASNCLFGIWKATSSTNNYPGQKLYSSPQVDLSLNANRLHYIDGVNFTPARDTLYWFGMICDTNTLAAVIGNVVGSGLLDPWGFRSREYGTYNALAPEPFQSRPASWLRADIGYPAGPGFVLPDPFPAYDGGTDFGGSINFYGGEGGSDWFPTIGLHYADAAGSGAFAGAARFSGTITGDGASTLFFVVHGLGTLNVDVAVQDANRNAVQVDVRATDPNTVALTFAFPPAAGQVYFVTVFG